MSVSKSCVVAFLLCLGSLLTAVAQPSLVSSNDPAAQLHLAWNPSPSPEVAGYFLCWGLASGQCTNRLDTGNVTETRVAGLRLGITYCFTVVAYGRFGEEAPPSNEVSATPPTPTLALESQLSSGTGMPVLRLLFQGQADHVYDVQASVDLESWETIGSTNAVTSSTIEYLLIDYPVRPRQFFRLSASPPP